MVGTKKGQSDTIHSHLASRVKIPSEDKEDEKRRAAVEPSCQLEEHELGAKRRIPNKTDEATTTIPSCAKLKYLPWEATIHQGYPDYLLSL